MKVVFDHCQDVARDTKTFWFRSDIKPDYVAGQFIEMSLPHQKPDDRGQKRWFTLSSSPSEDLLAITTKHSPYLASSFKKTLFALQPGMSVTISEPMGDFVLPKDVTIPLLFVSGGIGITPVRSIVKWLADTGQRRTLQIVYAARKVEDVAFQGLFTECGVPVNIIITEPNINSTRMPEVLEAKTALEFANMSKPLIYISGPEPLVEKLEADFLKENVPATRLVLDFYPGYEAML